MVTDCQFRSDLSDRVTCCFRRQSRRTGYTRVDLNRDDVFVFIRRNCELYVTPPGKIPDRTHHFDRHITHALESCIG
ncbi:hypothetical protein D3C86_1456140 [compost metagenome]